LQRRIVVLCVSSIWAIVAASATTDVHTSEPQPAAAAAALERHLSTENVIHRDDRAAAY